MKIKHMNDKKNNNRSLESMKQSSECKWTANLKLMKLSFECKRTGTLNLKDQTLEKSNAWKIVNRSTLTEIYLLDSIEMAEIRLSDPKWCKCSKNIQTLQ